MKKYKNFGLLVLALLFALPAAAQLGEERHNFAVGINGGLNMSSVSFNPKIKLNTLNTMSMGVTMRYMSEKYFKMMCGVQMEINYSQRGWDEKIEDDSGNSYSRTTGKNSHRKCLSGDGYPDDGYCTSCRLFGNSRSAKPPVTTSI